MGLIFTIKEPRRKGLDDMLKTIVKGYLRNLKIEDKENK
jgi:hypothetical protein|tara:strand:+ start:1408 stop:1524 length:117 start_codon:yes stop_codon:yes gene_type:complete